MPEETNPTEEQSSDKKVTDESNQKIVNFLSKSLGFIKDEKKPEDSTSTETTAKASDATMEDHSKPGDEEVKNAAGQKDNADDGGKEASGEKEPKPQPRRQVKKPAEQPSAQELVAETAKAVATEVAKQFSQHSSDSKKDSTDSFKVPDDYKEEWEALDFLSKKNPEKYSAAAHKRMDYYKSEDAYIQKWMDSNSGREYDPEDSEHDDFYKRHPKPLSDIEIGRALTSIDAEKIAEDKVSLERQEIRKLRAERVIERLEPVIEKSASTIKNSVIASITGSDKSLEDVKVEDPVLADIAERVVQGFSPLIQETVKIFNSDGLYDLDPQNRVHVDVADITIGLEDQIMALPADERVSEDGKRFATLREFSEMKPEDRRRRWTVSGAHVLAHVSAIITNETDRIVKAEKEKFERWGIQLPKGKAKEKEQSGQQNPAPKPVQHKSPPASTGDKIDTTKKQDVSKPQSIKEKLHSRMFGL